MIQLLKKSGIHSSAIVLLILTTACSTKKLTATHPSIKEIDTYIATVDANELLSESLEEGAITDAQGFNDKGSYEAYKLLDSNNTLYRIRYYETTEASITEKYYYRNNKLIYIDAHWNYPKTNSKHSKKIYLINTKVVYETPAEAIPTKLLVSKGKNFLKELHKK